MKSKSTENVYFSCDKCGRALKSKSGLTNHLKKCKWKDREICKGRGDLQLENQPMQPDESAHSSTQSNIREQEPVPAEEKFYWGERNGSDFSRDLDVAYEEIVYWRQNLFLVPTGNAGKRFIKEMTRLINSWLDTTAIKPVALKALMVMPALLLQKPSRISKSKDHSLALARRIKSWKKGNIQDLLHEGKTIQSLLNSSKKALSTNEISKRFIEKMSKGNINGAIKLLSDNIQNGILPLNDETLKLLKQKHPEGRDPSNDVLLPDTPIQIHPIRFEEIDSEQIRQSALKTRGGAGPSGLDGDGWRRILTSNSFGTEPSDLRSSI